MKKICESFAADNFLNPRLGELFSENLQNREYLNESINHV